MKVIDESPFLPRSIEDDLKILQERVECDRNEPDKVECHFSWFKKQLVNHFAEEKIK